MSERGRALASAVGQRELPFARVEERDAAYESLVERVVRWPCGQEVVRWLLGGVNAIRDGERVRVRRVLSCRNLRLVVGFSPGIVSTTLRRLRDSGLVRQADGEYRLRLSWLVQVSEVAESPKGEAGGPTPEEAATLLGRARARSGRARSVERVYTSPESVSVSAPLRASGGSPAPEQPELGGGERDGERAVQLLRADPAWRRLQGYHFRGAWDARQQAYAVHNSHELRAAFYAAAQAELIGTKREDKVRFLATAYDMASDQKIDSPVPCLLNRVAHNRCYRISEDGRRWANEQVREPEYRQADLARRGAEVYE